MLSNGNSYRIIIRHQRTVVMSAAKHTHTHTSEHISYINLHLSTAECVCVCVYAAH